MKGVRVRAKRQEKHPNRKSEKQSVFRSNIQVPTGQSLRTAIVVDWTAAQKMNFIPNLTIDKYLSVQDV